MNLVPVVAFLGLAGGGAAFALTRGGAPTEPAPGVFAPLVSGRWYRVLCTLGPAAQAATPSGADAQATALKVALQAEGLFPQAMTPAKTASQFVALGHYSGLAKAFANNAALTVLGVQEVAAPAQSDQATLTPANLDANIPLATAQAVGIALASEDDPQKLSEFASTLLPDYPAAAALLQTKAALRRAASPKVAQAAAVSGSFLCELYAPPTTPAETGKTASDRIGGESVFAPGDTLKSPSGQVTVKVLPNKVVLCDSRPGKADAVLWTTPDALHVGTFKFQGDGNLVVYDPLGKAVWASNTSRTPGAYLKVQDDGNMLIYKGNGEPEWETGTYGFKVGMGRNIQGGGGFFEDLGKSLDHMASDVAGAVDHAVKDVEHEIGKVPILKDVVIALEKADPISNMFLRIAKGERLDRAFTGGFDDAGKAAKTLGPYVETVVAVFPGVGPEVSSAIALGCALAEGKSMTDAAVDAACALVPGGPLVQMAARAAVSMGSALISGKPLDQAALGALRSAMPSKGLRAGFDVVSSLAQGKRLDVAAVAAIRLNLPAGLGEGAVGSLVGAAFDGCIALGQGKSLQDAGFASVRSMLPGNTAKQALDFAEKVTKAAEHKVPIEKFLVDELKGDLLKVGMNFVGDQALHLVASSSFLGGCKDAFDAVHKSVGEIVKTPVLGQLTSVALSVKLGVAEPVARAALSCVSVPPLANAANKAAANLVNNVTSAMVVVKTARLDQFARPTGTLVTAASVKFAVQRGAAGAQADAKTLAKKAHPADLRAHGKAADLAAAARLVRRAELVRFYLALKATQSRTASAVLRA